MSVRRPELAQPQLFPASAPGGLPLPAGAPPARYRRHSWASSGYLAQRLLQFKDNMKVSGLPCSQYTVMSPTCVSNKVVLLTAVTHFLDCRGELQHRGSLLVLAMC